MTTSYIKSLDFERKYKNRDQQDILSDDEYVKFKEEELNTKKMTTILKNLNSPKRKNQKKLIGGHSKKLSQTERNFEGHITGTS
jgi:hypothetical protein